MNNYNLTNILDQITIANLNNLASNLIQNNSFEPPNRNNWRGYNQDGGGYKGGPSQYGGDQRGYGGNYNDQRWNNRPQDTNNNIIPLMDLDNRQLYNNRINDNRTSFNDSNAGFNDNRLADKDIRGNTNQRGAYSGNRYNFNDNRQNFNNNHQNYNSNRPSYLDSQNERGSNYNDNENRLDYKTSVEINKVDFNRAPETKNISDNFTITRRIENDRCFTSHDGDDKYHSGYNRNTESHSSDNRQPSDYFPSPNSRRLDTHSPSTIISHHKNSSPTNRHPNDTSPRSSQYKDRSPSSIHHNSSHNRRHDSPHSRHHRSPRSSRHDSPRSSRHDSSHSRRHDSPQRRRRKRSVVTYRRLEASSPNATQSAESRKRQQEDEDYRSIEDSRKRSRDRSSERERSRNRSSERERSRNRSSERESWDNKDRQDVIVRVKNLPEDVQEEDFDEELRRHGLMAESVRIFKRSDPGKRLAFVEFKTPNDAQHWIKRTKGEISLAAGRKSILYMDNDPSPPSSSSSSSHKTETPSVILRGDWKCSKCGCVNFKRREKCFKCKLKKQETDYDIISEDGSYFVGLIATDTMLIRFLNMITDEARIKEALYYATKVTANDVFIVRDSKDRTSCGYGFIWLPSVEDSVKIMEAIRVSHPLSIDGVTVSLNYCRTTFLSVKVFLSHKGHVINSLNDQLNSQLQHQQAQQQQAALQQPQTRRLAPPDANRYIYDEGSTFYYDPLTKLHYDSNSQYFYDSEKRLYLYWDGNNQFYVEVKGDNDQTEVAAVADVNVVDEAKKQEAEKARKLAQQMHRWAEQQNKKEVKTTTTTDKSNNNGVFKTPMLPMATKKSTADAGFNMLQKKLSEKQQKDADDKPNILTSLVDSYGSGSDDEEGGVARKETLAEIEERMTEWDKKACLLCKRVFMTADMLHKHKALSSLHKENLEKYRQKMQGKVVAVEQTT